MTDKIMNLPFRQIPIRRVQYTTLSPYRKAPARKRAAAVKDKNNLCEIFLHDLTNANRASFHSHPFYAFLCSTISRLSRPTWQSRNSTLTPAAFASASAVPNSGCVPTFGLTSVAPSIWITKATSSRTFSTLHHPSGCTQNRLQQASTTGRSPFIS